jgi:hypothetical protein
MKMPLKISRLMLFRYYPMMSVFKFPLALAILHLVDERKIGYKYLESDGEGFSEPGP